MAEQEERHPEDYCHRCERPNVSWHAPSPLWNVVMRRDGVDRFDGIVCPTCFAFLAAAMGAAAHFRLDAPAPLIGLPTTNADGKVWDPNADLWVDRTAVAEELRPGQVILKDRLTFHSFDGREEVQVGQGEQCVFLMIVGRGAVVLSDAEAEALGVSLIRRAAYARPFDG